MANIWGGAPVKEIKSASNADLILCLVGMNAGSRMYKYEFKTAEQIAKELKSRGVLDNVDEFVEAYIKRTSW